MTRLWSYWTNRQSTAAAAKTTRLIDNYGNTTQTQVFDYGNLNTPARTYSNTYLTDPNYTFTTVNNAYDGTALTSRTGLSEHDDLNYPAAFTYRGNLTQSSTPGAVQNRAYDITGFTVSQDDGHGHSVAITPATGMNNAVPGTVTPNGDSRR